VQTPGDVFGALADVFQWVGFGGAVVFGLLAVLLRAFDGTWLPARAVVETVDGAHVVRWIDEAGGVNEASLSAQELGRIGDRDMADIFYRRGWENRMRLTRGSPAVKLALWLAGGLALLGMVALVVSLTIVAMQG
jgi:hypothetical protein